MQAVKVSRLFFVGWWKHLVAEKTSSVISSENFSTSVQKARLLKSKASENIFSHFFYYTTIFIYDFTCILVFIIRLKNLLKISNKKLLMNTILLPIYYIVGLFFIVPCVDDYRIVDMRTISFDVPPQEVCILYAITECCLLKKNAM